MSWVTLVSTALLPGKPWTSAKALAVYENPIAIAGGENGAPRIACHTFGGAAVSSGALVVGGLSDWQGASIFYNAYNSGVSAGAPTIALSSDGSTFGTPTSLPDVEDSGSGCLYVDFATGDFKVTFGDQAGAHYSSGTISGGGASVQAFRISVPADMTVTLTGHATGGEAAS